MPAQKIEQRLKQYRIKAGLTQEELAERLGVTRQTIHAIENNKYEPSLTLALKIAIHFDTPLTHIFNLK